MFTFAKDSAKYGPRVQRFGALQHGRPGGPMGEKESSPGAAQQRCGAAPLWKAVYTNSFSHAFCFAPGLEQNV